MPPEPAERDAALILDMLLAARDAVNFVATTNAAAFMASRLHQFAVIRALEVLGEAAGKYRLGSAPRMTKYRGARRPRCASG